MGPHWPHPLFGRYRALRVMHSAVISADPVAKEYAMAAPAYAFDIARTLFEKAEELIADAKRISAIADRVQDTVIGNQLKNEVSQLIILASQLSELARSLPTESERASKKGY
jgi:hypothetical protein